ncbi:RIP metalloprotease RseP [Anaeromyxobacter paludicola]|uniref:Zinc metalloprotease n=1 Tax=Anaeromyxobacter paludicola TaxID=2918171 RepID=A0ABM7X8X8_9BACT|nr:RIP metalloprotease RseP [Anaeromyxobacter paludicola]BDG08300.1 RIP metalloprotease RseP [Anaeromyxobacter paludicola]
MIPAVALSAAASFLAVALVVVLAFSFLIVIHEAGHFAVARACGMRVERFSVGYGPVVWSTRRGETEYAISILPFGGYVKIAGMAPDEEIAPGDPAAYSNQPAWRRFLVILTGPAMNYVGAVLLAWAMIATTGIREPDPAPAVGEVVAGSAAERAGLREGDRIVAVDGAPVGSWAALVSAVQARPSRPVRLDVERGGAPLALTAVPDAIGGRGRLGLGPSMRLVRAPPAAALGRGLALTNARAGDILAGLGQMVSRKQQAELRGPVGIAQEMAKSARAGLAPFLSMVWFISIVLALFNLLPIPALDGGRLVFLCYEIVTRRRVDEKVESTVHLVGFIAIFGLILLTVFGDLARLFHR